MSIRFNIQVDAAGLITRARELSATMKQVQRPTREIARRLIENGMARLQARPPGKYPPVRTGLLARSLYARPTSATGVVVASQFPYARIQQMGGEVEPVTAKCLAIPMIPALKRNGIWPRDWPKGELTFILIDKGNIVGRLVKTADVVKLAAKEAKVLASAKSVDTRESRKVKKLQGKIAELTATKWFRPWENKRTGRKLATTRRQLRDEVFLDRKEIEFQRDVNRSVLRKKLRSISRNLPTQYLLVNSVVLPCNPYLIWDQGMKNFTREVWARYLKGAAVG